MSNTKTIFKTFRKEYLASREDTNLKRTTFHEDVTKALIKEATRLIDTAKHPFYTIEMVRNLSVDVMQVGHQYVLHDRGLLRAGLWWAVVFRISVSNNPIHLSPTLDEVLSLADTEILISTLDSLGAHHALDKILNITTRPTIFEPLRLEGEIIQDTLLLACLQPENYSLCTDYVRQVYTEVPNIFKLLHLKTSRKKCRSLLSDFLKYGKGHIAH